MREKVDELAWAWVTRQSERVSRIAAVSQTAVNLALALATAALSVLGLVAQHRVDPLNLAFCAILCAALLLHRVGSRVCFLAVAAVAFGQWLLADPQLADAAVLIALYWVALESGLVEMAIAAGIVEAGAIMAALRWSPTEPLKIWVGLSGLATAAGVLGITVRQRRALLDSLRERAARLESERDQEGRLAAAAERARIAREMHDIVAHNLTVMIALADGATYAMDGSCEQAAEATRRVSATGRQALVEMRRLLGVLRDGSAAQPLEPQPGIDRLDELLSRVDAAGIPVTIEMDGDPRKLTQGVQLTIFRIAQEALTNTLKHAQRPACAHLALRCRQGQVELEVTDTGNGAVGGDLGRARAAHGGRGLRGMRERAAAYGGQLQAGPRPEGGWRVQLRLAAEGEDVSA